MSKSFSILLLFSLSLVCSGSAYAHDAVTNKRLAIIDAGSSGSRVHLYQAYWSPKSDQYEVKALKSLKVEPGLSVLSEMNNPKLLTNYLRPMADFIDDNKANNLPSPAVYWFSTAGMRLVPPLEQAASYNNVRLYFESRDITVVEMETIPGWKEGVFMWLGSNYHRKRLHRPVGIIDMGGASTQITYLDSKHANIELNFNGQKYLLYSKSYLGLGRNEMRHQVTNHDVCFKSNHTLPNGAKGQGNFAHCLQDAVLPLLKIHAVSAPGINAPHQREFIAFDGFYHLSTYSLNSKPLSLELLKRRGKVFCYGKLSPSQLKQQGAFDDCFNTAYYYGLLRQYGFRQQQKISVSDGDWTLGAALFIANQANSKLQLKRQK